MSNPPTVTAAIFGIVVSVLTAKASLVVGLLPCSPSTAMLAAILSAPFGIAASLAGQRFLEGPGV